MTAVLLLGLPGAGKSTVADALTTQGRCSWLSASHVLRDHAQHNPDVATDWNRLWSVGKYAPDSEVLPVLWEAYSRSTGLVLLDGYPRTTDQLADFSARGGALKAVILLRIPPDTATDRLRARAAREGRTDDAAHVARRRVTAEHARIEELRALAAVRAVLAVIDADARPEEVTDRVLKTILRITHSQPEG